MQKLLLIQKGKQRQKQSLKNKLNLLKFKKPKMEMKKKRVVVNILAFQLLKRKS